VSKLFVFPERNNKISKHKYRKEIDALRDNNLQILPLTKGCDIDELNDFNSQNIKSIAEDIRGKAEGFGVNLYIARKYIKFKKELNQELKYKKFLLLNTILALSVLSKGGNFVIKLYDTYTHFTISILYILNNYFSQLTIVKPFSTRPHTASRYLICQKLTEAKPKILDYLYSFYDQYLVLLENGNDMDFVYPVSKIIKDENFQNYLIEINSQITEQRIETLEELKKAIEGNPTSKYDKMDIKKKCLDLWKIPVLNFDPRKLLANQPSHKKNDGKLLSLQDIAKQYEDYDKNNEATSRVLSIFDSKKKVEVKEDTKEIERKKKEEDDLKKAKFEQLLNNNKKTKKKTDKDESLINKKRKRDEGHDEREAVKDDLAKKKEKILETSMRNREIIGILFFNLENTKIVPSQSILAELEKYKKKN
jgi:hypothetical protein